MASKHVSPTRTKVWWPAKKGAKHLAILLLAVVMIYPLLWMLAGSFRPAAEIFTSLSIIPSNFTLEHWVQGWQGTGISFSVFFINSFIISSLTVVGTVASCSIVAYAFARLQFPLRKLWFGLMLSTLMLSSQVTIVPRYILFQAMGWVDTYLPLVVPAFLATDAFFVFLIMQFIRSIPPELDEAATVDGCGPMRIFWHILLPLLRPALATTAVFSFIWSYGDFFNQLIYISDPQRYTVALGLRAFLDATGQSQWGSLMAMSTASLIPVFILFALFQRHLIRGIATSGLK